MDASTAAESERLSNRLAILRFLPPPALKNSVLLRSSKSLRFYPVGNLPPEETEGG